MATIALLTDFGRRCHEVPPQGVRTTGYMLKTSRHSARIEIQRGTNIFPY